jgi:hypothetical protein
MVIAQPAPFVSTFVDAVDQAIREHSPRHGMSAMPRPWLAFCVTAVLVTNSMCWARFARASLGTYALAALSLDVSTQQNSLGHTLGGERPRHPAPLWPGLG